MEKRDYYESLGIDRSADETAIKKAYRNLAMQYHPDRNPGDSQAADRMKEINEAYAVLSDSQKRRLYDTCGHAGLEGFSQEDIFRGVDFSSLFREFGLGEIFGFGDNIFDSFFGRRTGYDRGPQRGADLRYDISLTLEEAALGTEKTIELPRAETCASCNGAGAQPEGLFDCESCGGTGQIVKEQRSGYSIFRQITVCNECKGKGKIMKKACEDCEGKGFIEKVEEIKVSIPAGADTGYRIRIEGKGEKGDGLPGDLYIIVNVERHPVFERHGDDVYLQQEIDVFTAALGGKIEVPSLNGELELDIPEGTQTGTVFRIEDKGITHLGSHGSGDEYVIAKVIIPVNLSRKEKGLLKQLQKLRQESGGNKGEQDRKR